MVRVTHQPEAAPQPEHEGVADELREYLRVSRSHLDQLARAMRDIGSPAVLETATVTIDATGVFTRSYRVPYASLAIVNTSLTGALTVTSAGPQAAAPGGGQGQIYVQAGGAGAWNMTGQAITIYGPPGAVVPYCVMVARIQPQAAAAAAVALPYGAASITAAGSATAPGATTAIATTAALGLGLYEVTVRAYLTGAAAGGDADNLELVDGTGGPVLGVISLPPAADVAPAPYTLRVRGTGTALVVQTIGAGTAGVGYHVTVTATQIGP